MSSPPSMIRPASGCSKPAIIRSVVVFPEPDGPRSVKNSPSPTVRSMPSTATTSPYALRAPSTRTSAAKATLEDVEPALELLVADRERGEDPDDVAVDAAAEQHQAVVPGCGDDAGGLVRRLLRELDRQHRSEPAHLGAGRRHRLEPLAQPGTDLVGARPVLAQRVEDRDRGGARHRVAAEGAAEAAGRHGVDHLGPAGDGCERQPAAERLAGDEQIWLDLVVLDRPDRAGAAAARLHLVVDVEDPVVVEELSQTPREVGRHGDEAALALHRLEHGAGDRLRIDVALEEPLQRVD